MGWRFGPERAEAIRVLQEQIRRARARLQGIGATADAEETSFHLRDQTDIAYGEVSREVAAMEEALKILRRDLET